MGKKPKTSLPPIEPPKVKGQVIQVDATQISKHVDEGSWWLAKLNWIWVGNWLDWDWIDGLMD